MTCIRRFLVVLAAAVVVAITGAPQASAHPLNTSAVLLDVNDTDVTVTVELPLDQLGVAMGQELTASSVLDGPTLPNLRIYVRDHMTASDSSGQTWVTEVTGGRVEDLNGVDNLVLDATLTPAAGKVGDFTLRYDAVVDKLLSHRIFVSARYGHTGTYTTLAMLSWQTQSVPVVSADATSRLPERQGFLSAVRLGVEHISGGSDHLLFLIMLLLPATLTVSGRRWAQREDLGTAGWRVLHVVTAFAVGHSVTLALGALGWIHLPTRLVESGIALSVLVSAIHAIRPLVRRGEVLIGGTFGLLHGLAFAALLSQLDLSRSGLVTTLLGFNIGIELTQLIVVLLVIPSLMVISRTAAYPTLRTGLAALGAAVATGWLLERTGLLTRNPLEPLGTLLVQYPAPLSAGLALVATLCLAAQRTGHLPQVKSTEAT